MSFFLNVNFVAVECCNCHVQFAMTKEMNDKKRDDHKTFHCPNGHAQHYSGKSEAEKLRLELQRAKQNEAYLEDRIKQEQEKKNAARHQTRAFKGQVTRIKNRVGNGVCPACNRSFSNLHAHMCNQHPDYKKETA